ncbi:MAG: UDP-N-acetylmuramoyl-L-alanyl-D-glutamate--2,6-diaminopimelate ligase [Candidatus Daviesbacteria bacterium]|nr:UDP-N-acetylmuramoyl-L-alanyl-D-glutamate--2,6-diaminopimelate ligase [Candidatus Daviesbacteria bacterium]
MKKLIKVIFSQALINIFYHLPKATLANVVYGFPTRRLKVIGITGTDGKSTTTNMVYQILKAAGKAVSMVSTINAVVGGKAYETGFHVTSPDPFTVQKFAKKALDNGDEFLVLEATSHALDQYRFWGIKFDVGVITNVTHEHLDYHKTFENYLKTKFKLLHDVKFAVINLNLSQYTGRSHKLLTKGKIITFGLDKGDFNQKDLKLNLKIPGDYNIENALASLAVAFVLGIDKKIALRTLENFTGIRGRMEEVKNRKGIKIIIDFAHTPNGLKQVLTTLRSQVRPGRLTAIIGAEGYRDVGKRAMMGETAQRLADFVVVTAVDPRGQLDIINRQISDGAKKAGAKKGINFFIIDDRSEAIKFAINRLAKKKDVVGIFGKGHEASMNLDGKKEIPWSDFEAVQFVLAKSARHGAKNRSTTES